MGFDRGEGRQERVVNGRGEGVGVGGRGQTEVGGRTRVTEKEGLI